MAEHAFQYKGDVYVKYGYAGNKWKLTTVLKAVGKLEDFAAWWNRDTGIIALTQGNVEPPHGVIVLIAAHDAIGTPRCVQRRKIDGHRSLKVYWKSSVTLRLEAGAWQVEGETSVTLRLESGQWKL